MTCEEKIKKGFSKMDIKELEKIIKNNKNVYTDEVYNWALECYNLRSSELRQNEDINNTSAKLGFANYKKTFAVVLITALIAFVSCFGIFTLICANKPEEKSNQATTKTIELSPSLPSLYVGSKNSDKYHKPDCQWAKKIKTYNKVIFNSSGIAKSKGYSPCGTCID